MLMVYIGFRFSIVIPENLVRLLHVFLRNLLEFFTLCLSNPERLENYFSRTNTMCLKRKQSNDTSSTKVPEITISLL